MRQRQRYAAQIAAKLFATIDDGNANVDLWVVTYGALAEILLGLLERHLEFMFLLVLRRNANQDLNCTAR